MPSRARPWIRWAILGFLGALGVAVLPFAVGYLPDHVAGPINRYLPWVRDTAGRFIFRTTALLGSIALFFAWLRLRPDTPHTTAERIPTPPLRRIAVLWTIPFLLVPPVMTADPFAYAAQGWLLHEGKSPYDYAMGFPGPFADGVYPAWRPTTAVYPPLALHLQHLIVDLTGTDPYWSVVGMRLLAIAGVAGMVIVGPLLARQLHVDPRLTVWFIALNPLILIQFIGGAHNDALMVAAVMLSLWLARRFGLVPAAIMIGIAASLKQPAVLAGIGVVLYGLFGEDRTYPPAGADWIRALRGLVLGGLIGAATFLALSVPGGLGLGWMGSYTGSPNQVINHSPLSWLGQAAMRLGVRQGVVDGVLGVVSGLLILGAVVWLVRLWAFTKPIRFTAGILLAFGLLGTAIQPWYVLWGGALLPLCRVTPKVARVAMSLTLLLLLSGVLQEWWSPVIVVPLCALPAYAWYRWGASIITPAPR